MPLEPTSAASADQPVRILVVDDEPLVREVMSVFLSGSQYHVVLAADGEEGLRIFTEDPDAFDIVMTDRFMPGISGEELALEVKKLRPEQPLLLLTGCGEESEHAPLIPGVDALVAKPFTLSKLRAAMQQVCPRA